MLVFVIPAIYPAADCPGVGIYVKEQCEAICRCSDLKMVVLNAAPRSLHKWKYCNHFHIENEPTGPVYCKFTKGIMLSRLPRLTVHNYEKNLKEIFAKAIQDQGKPDVIYAHFTFPSGFIAYKLSREYGIPYVVDEHYSLYFGKISNYLKRITKITIENSSSFLCVSNNLQNAIYNHVGIKKGIDVIPNLVGVEYTYQAKVKNQKFVFFAAGNLYKSKKFDLLINAFVKAFSEKEEVELIIAGDGPQRDEIISLIKEYGREKQIIMKGRLDKEKMIECYKACDAFVLFSEYETFGIVYREAMAIGRPVISAKNGGIQENWNDCFGMLTDDNSVENATKTLRKMYENVDNYNNKLISQMCLEMYSADNIANSIIKRLLSACADKKEDCI